jgi:hypothetical protein
VTAPGSDSWSSGSAYESYIGRWSRLVAPEFLDWLGATGPASAFAAALAEPARRAFCERLRLSVEAEPDGTIRLTARAWAVRGRSVS